MAPSPIWLSSWWKPARCVLRRLIVRERTGRRIRIPMGGLWSGIARRGMRLRCCAGVAWVTVAGDARDHILEAGQGVVLRSGGRLVVQALGNQDLIVVVGGDHADREDGHAWIGR